MHRYMHGNTSSHVIDSFESLTIFQLLLLFIHSERGFECHEAQQGPAGIFKLSQRIKHLDFSYISEASCIVADDYERAQHLFLC